MNDNFYAQKKILYVIHGYPPHKHAGTENYSFSLAKKITTKNTAVAAFYPVKNQNIESPELNIKEIKNHTAFEVKINESGTVNNLFNEEIERIFLQIINFFKPDIIHFQHIHTDLPFALLTHSISLKIPTVITLHDFWYICPKTYMLNENGTLCSGPTSPEKCAKCFLKNEYLTEIDNKNLFYYFVDLFKKRLEMSRVIFSNANLTTSPSKFLLEKYKEHVRFNKSLRIPLGLDVTRQKFTKNTAGSIRFGFLGNITALKNVRGLIDSFLQTSGGASLHIYGEINDCEIFKKLNNKSLIDHCIIFHGCYSPKDLSKILSQIDIGVVPSFFENYPLVVREFLSAKIPVIASRVGGIPEIIKHNENGLLFDPLIKDDLLTSLQKVIDNPELISILSSQISPIKTIDQDASVWLEIYNSLTSNLRK